MSLHVAVLHGGISSERTVSLSSGRAIAAALREGGYAVTLIDMDEDIAQTIVELRKAAPDVVFNALHGRLGEDGAIQGVLEWLGLKYTHCGIRASAVAMDKEATRQVLQAAGLPVAHGMVVDMSTLAAADPLPLPYVVKPLAEGSSVGVEILRKGDNRRAEIATGWRFGPTALVEEFVPGRELTVAVMGGRALTVTDIVPKHATDGFYDFDAKYADGGSVHQLPAEIHPEAFEQALRLAEAAHRALGCTGATRTDFRYDDTSGDGPGRLTILEVNTQPGMTPTSLLPEQAAYEGITYPALCDWIVQEALSR